MTDSIILKPASFFTSQVVDKFYPKPGTPPGDTFRLGKLRHMRFEPGMLSIFTGISGHGKSLLLGQLVLDVISKGGKVVIASFEMAAWRTLQRMVRQCIGAECPDKWLIEQCLEWIGKRVLIYDRMGTADKEELFATFHRAAKEQAYTHFIVDSLMKCGIGEEDWTEQKAFVDRMQNFAQADNVHVHLVAHARKGVNEDAAPGKMDVKGSGGITDLADNVFSVWRNKRKESALNAFHNTGALPSKVDSIDDLITWPDALLECVKHREQGGDAEKQYWLYFDPASLQYMERQGQKPHYYFEGKRP